MYHALDRKRGCRGSMAATLHAVRHAHDERVRQFIQHMLAQPERHTVTWPVTQNNTYGNHTR